MSRNALELPPYAVTAANSRGREHADPYLDAADDPFAVDYQRVLHCTAFRRLMHKTQVFVSGEHDHYRTRLTHTLEVADLARRLCTALRVNSLVGELIALAHDLGHPPFGHAGESALAALMAGHGGFEHNAQSLRVVEYLEHPYPAFRGLNLCFEVRESLAKHCTIYDKPGIHPLADGAQAPLEGQIANLADRIAYDGHDLEDALGAGLLAEQDLLDLELWRQAADELRRQYPDLPLAAVRRPILNRLEELMLADVVRETRRRLAETAIAKLDDLRSRNRPLAAMSNEMGELAAELEEFLLAHVYCHRRLLDMDKQAEQIIAGLFQAYLADPRRLPPRFQRRLDGQGPPRVICDYLAGMTDRFCREEWASFY